MANYSLTIQVFASGDSEYNSLKSYLNSYSGQYSSREDNDIEFKSTVIISGVYNLT